MYTPRNNIDSKVVTWYEYICNRSHELLIEVYERIRIIIKDIIGEKMCYK